MTFKLFAHQFFEKRRIKVASKLLAPTTYHTDELRFQHLEAVFGHFEMALVTTRSVEEYLEYLVTQGKSLALANRYRSLLSVFFEEAIKAGQIKDNPVDRIKPFPEKRTRRRAPIWDAKELDKYLSVASRISPQFGVGAAILGLAGPRISELLALTHSDLLWKENLIRINKLVEYHTQSVQHRTKGQKHLGHYMLIMFPRLKKLLREWCSLKKFKGDEFLLTHADGRLFTYDQFYDYHYQAIYMAGLKPIPIHSLRRTYASLAARNGFHLVEISKMLGHETLGCVEAYVQNDLNYLVEKAKKCR